MEKESMIHYLDDAVYFDTETLSLNPHEAYHNRNAKMILAQFGKKVKNKFKVEVFKEWDYDEEKLLSDIINYFCKLKQYTPVFTYNGEFDFRYLNGRLRYNNTNDNDYYNIHEIIRKVKHCDMIQYNNGYFMSFDILCNYFGIDTKNNFNGEDVSWQYEEGDYDAIVAHGVDDIERLYRLVNETSLADRFYKKDYGFNLWKNLR